MKTPSLHLGNPSHFIAMMCLFLLALASARAQSDSATTVARAQNSLLQLTVSDSMDTEVSMPIRDGLVELKNALANQTDFTISQLPAATTTAVVKQQLGKVLPSPAVGKIPDDQWRKWMESDSKTSVPGLYGGELTVSVKRLRPSLLLVQETFSIACGTDNVLLVYSNQ